VLTVSLAPRKENSTKEAMNEYNIKFWQIEAPHGRVEQMEV
jgi:hypothetical protein